MMICGQPWKGKTIMQFEEEKAMECGNLSSSLQKLYIWEKKLLKEVKVLLFQISSFALNVWWSQFLALLGLTLLVA